MEKKRLIKKAFDNIVCGKYLIIKDKSNSKMGIFFEKNDGNIIYKGIIEKINKSIQFNYFPIEISIPSKNIRTIVTPYQYLPTHLNYFFNELFDISPYKSKDELEKKIEEIEINYEIK